MIDLVIDPRDPELEPLGPSADGSKYRPVQVTVATSRDVRLAAGGFVLGGAKVDEQIPVGGSLTVSVPATDGAEVLAADRSTFEYIVTLTWSRVGKSRETATRTLHGLLPTSLGATVQVTSLVNSEPLPAPYTSIQDIIDGVADITDPVTAGLVGTASSTRTALDARFAKKSDQILNVRDYGAVGNGTVDDTNAIQAAINDAQSRITNNGTTRQDDGFTILLPKGRWKITGSLLVSGSNVTLAGEGASGSVLYAPNCNFDMVKFEHASLSLYNVGVRDLRFSTPGNATAGHCLSFKRVIYARVTNVTFNGWFSGLYAGGASKLICAGLIFAQETRTSGTTAQAVKVSSETGISGDIHFTDCQIMQNLTTHGVNAWVVTGVDGLYVSNSHWHGAFQINPSNAGHEHTLASVFITGCYFDGSAGDLLELIGTAATAYGNIKVSNSYFRGAALRGVRVEASSVITRLAFVGCTFSGSTRNGIDMRNANATGTIISGCQFTDNNVGNGAWGDVSIHGTGTRLSDSHHSGGGAAGYAVAVSAAAVNPSVSGVDVSGSTATAKYSHNNNSTLSSRGMRGVVLQNRGIAAVASGVTSHVVTHGLSAVPGVTVDAIQVTPHGQVPAYWVSGMSSTQFTINFASATASAVNVGWVANAER